VRLQDFVINTDVIVLSTPEIEGLPYVISGLVAAGGLAAALSTADGLLLAIANALSHDIYYKMIDPNAPAIRRLTVARILLFFVAVAAAATAATKPSDILAMVGWAFSLAWPFFQRSSGSGGSGRRRQALFAASSPDLVCAYFTSSPRAIPGCRCDTGMTSLLNPLTRLQWSTLPRRWHCQCDGELARAGTSVGQQGRLVQPQQHQLRLVGNALGFW
jgi:cation/acetate symporter